jgi:mono/diheme cytochrome c family protein
MKAIRSAMGGFALALACARGASLVQQAPAQHTNRSNPLEGDEQARQAGAKLYARECASCHGQDRAGLGKAPPLNRAEIRQATPGALFWVLRNGSLHRGMPSFAHLPEPQRWQIITFLRGLDLD